MEELLPEWAIGKTSGEYVLGAQLCTRDGRRTGNAHIVGFDGVNGLTLNDVTYVIYIVLTDAGNVIKLIRPELESMFYPPQWVSDVNTVIRKFGSTEE